MSALNQALVDDHHEHYVGPPYVPGGQLLTNRIMRTLQHSHVGGRSQHSHAFGWTADPTKASVPGTSSAAGGTR